MRRALAFSLVALGVSSLVAQVLAIRELLVVFVGNEFFIGWTLFAWLFWTAAGALLAGRFSVGRTARASVVCHALVALLLPATLVPVRQARTLTGALPGALPDLLPAMVFSFAVLAPIGLVLGAQFVAGSRAWNRAGGQPEPGRAQGAAYALETAGFVAGGLLFSFGLVLANVFRVAGLVGGLNVLAGLAVCRAAGAGRRLRWLPLLAAAPALALVLGGGRLDRATAAWRFPGQALVESRTSIYGNLAVTRVGGQLNFYENGLLLGAEDDRPAAEPLVHYPMLAHPAPQQVLLVGGGFNGALGEILKHDPRFVDYVELDPELVGLAQKYLAPARRAALADARVNVVFADARRFLARPDPGNPVALYDVVILNLPGPGTVLINRYYTRDFFRAVRRRLAPGGMLAVRLAFSPDYVGRELGNLGASIYRTLLAEFAAVSLLPDYDLLYLASAAPGPAPDPAQWIARHAARGLATDYVVPPAIAERLRTDRIERVRGIFAAGTDGTLNRDDRPVACHYHLAYWLRSFHPRAAELANALGARRGPWGAGAVALAVLGMLAATRGPAGARRTGAWAMGVGSFSLMACELVLLLAFQIFCGYLYYRIALILAALMLGMAGGTALGIRGLDRAGPRRLAVLHALAGAYALGLVLFMRAMERFGHLPPLELLFLVLAAAIGALVGCEFPVANRIYLAPAATDSPRAGVVYGADLAAACLAALLIGLWALPVLGARTTLALVACLNFGTAAICGWRRAG